MRKHMKQDIERNKKKYSLFAQSVREIVEKIPKGKVLSYKEVAEKSGYPFAARAVGSVMRMNLDKAVPCHRVVRSDGRIGEYNRGGSIEKTRLLKREGIIIENGKIVSKKQLRLDLP